MLLLQIFAVDLDESRDIQHMRNMILKHVQSASAEALNYMKTFSMYEYIWLEDKQLYLQRFLNECQQKCSEDNDFTNDKIQDANAQIELFQAQVLSHHQFEKKKTKYSHKNLKLNVNQILD